MLSCLQELAQIDLKAAATENVKENVVGKENGQPLILDVNALQELSSERLNNVLRYWIRVEQHARAK